MATEPKADHTGASPGGVHRVRAKLTGAGAAAKRKVQGLRGRNSAAIADPVSVEAATPEVVPPEPSESVATQAWTAIKRARVVIFVALALSQALLALISWRIRASRGRRAGQGTEQDALEALGERLGGIAGTLEED